MKISVFLFPLVLFVLFLAVEAVEAIEANPDLTVKGYGFWFASTNRFVASSPPRSDRFRVQLWRPDQGPIELSNDARWHLPLESNTAPAVFLNQSAPDEFPRVGSLLKLIFDGGKIALLSVNAVNDEGNLVSGREILSPCSKADIDAQCDGLDQMEPMVERLTFELWVRNDDGRLVDDQGRENKQPPQFVTRTGDTDG